VRERRRVRSPKTMISIRSQSQPTSPHTHMNQLQPRAKIDPSYFIRRRTMAPSLPHTHALALPMDDQSIERTCQVWGADLLDRISRESAAAAAESRHRPQRTANPSRPLISVVAPLSSTAKRRTRRPSSQLRFSSDMSTACRGLCWKQAQSIRSGPCRSSHRPHAHHTHAYTYYTGPPPSQGQSARSAVIAPRCPPTRWTGGTIR
jgi:hypothetical protein